MLRCALLLALFVAPSGAGETIDRIAVTVGKQAITESAIALEIRLVAFLNGDAPDFGPANRKATAERMLDQVLMRNEMSLSQYPMPEVSAVEELLRQVKSQRFSSEAEYRGALRKYGIREEELNEHLLKQISTLRFIDIRFRPGVQLLETEMREYYEKRLVAEWQNEGRKPVPSFEEWRPAIERALVEERVNRLVESWMQETRSRTRIQFMEKAFQ